MPEPPACQSVTATPATVNACTPTEVAFSASATGAAPITYRWDFGDGSQPQEGDGLRSVRHTFPAPDLDNPTQTYTTRLTLSNVAGVDRSPSCAADVTIQCLCADNFDLPVIFFDRNSSVLDDQPNQEEERPGDNRRNAAESRDVLQLYPVTNVLLVGYAWDYERGGLSLAEARVEAVSQFYQEGGIDANRIQTLAMRLESRPKPVPPRVFSIPYCDDGKRAEGRINSLVLVLQDLLSRRAVNQQDINDILDVALEQGVLESQDEANQVRTQLDIAPRQN